jgi:hypothetical protein
VRNHSALTIDLGVGGNSADYLLGGWSHPERGFAWTSGPTSSLRLPRPAAPNGWVLEIDCSPYLHPPALQAQTLIVRVDGKEIGTTRLRFAHGVGYWVPPTEPDGSDIIAELDHPDATPPRDISSSLDARPISLMVRAIRMLVIDEPTALPPVATSAIRLDTELVSQEAAAAAAAALIDIPARELVARFEALIGNCEFGFFQRRCGAEPLSLLRFAAGRMRPVYAGIESGFAGLGETEDIKPILNARGNEWMIEEQRFGLIYHTFTPPDQATQEAMRSREAIKLKFLARKFMEDVADGSKIFVCKDELGMSVPEVTPLLLALNRRGPCTMLWATGPDTPARQPGTVEMILPRLYRGYLDRLSPRHDPSDLSVAGWLSVCVNAFLLFRQYAGGRQ